MTEVTGLQHVKETVVHKDRSSARMTRDTKDAQLLLNYFSDRKPFSNNSNELYSLPSGVIPYAFLKPVSHLAVNFSQSR